MLTRGKKQSWRGYCSVTVPIPGRLHPREDTHLKLLINQGKLDDALRTLDSVDTTHSAGSDYIYARLIQLCVRLKAFARGMHVHDHIVRHDFEPNHILWNALVNLYGKCGCLCDARKLFDGMPRRDVFSWTIMIEAYAKHEASEDALLMFLAMESNGIRPDEICFLSVLKACGGLRTLREGRVVHSCIVMYGFESNVLVNSSLIDMYSKCGSLDDALHGFLNTADRDVVVWNLMISGYAECGDHGKAVELSKLMQQEGLMCNGFTFFCILQACVNTGLNACRHVHVWALHGGVELALCFFNNLINSYFKYGALVEAREVFDRAPNPEIITWNTMLSGYVQHGLSEDALILLQKMVQERVKPDSITIAAVVKACASSREALKDGMEVHRYVYLNGMESDRFMASTLIDFYGSCGELEDAHNVFDRLQHKDVVCWNSMISVLIRQENAQAAFELFRKMMAVEVVEPDEATFVCVLKACAHLTDRERGSCVHTLVTECRIHLDAGVGNTLLDMYAKCNSLHDACAMFNRLGKQDLVTWNAMIAGYAQCNHIEGALDVFEQMQCNGINPDKVTFLNILKACTNAGRFNIGHEIHAAIDKAGLSSNAFLRNALIDMYAKCGRMDMAVEVFGELSERDIISWNAVITGYSQHGHGQEVYGAFLEMLREGVSPNEVTFITVLKVCSDLVSVSYGKKIHVIMRETSYACDAFVRSTLLDMYAKCGNIMDASSLFENTMDQDKVSCNVMMAGYAQHGFFNKALMIFHRMCLSDDKLDHITCISIICACNYIGLVSEGCTYFTCMMLDDGIKPSIETYGCLIDLIGRGGQLDVALHLAENLPCSPSVDIWMSLVSASKFCNNVDLAACAAEYVIEQEPGNTAAVLLLSNMIV